MSSEGVDLASPHVPEPNSDTASNPAPPVDVAVPVPTAVSKPPFIPGETPESPVGPVPSPLLPAEPEAVAAPPSVSDVPSG
jgi:hypothetical protein